jgi:ABC-type transporter lipoprotein component MlaA
MPARKGAILGCALLLTLAACGRRLPTPWVETRDEPPGQAAQPVELAGGPEDLPASGTPPSEAPASQGAAPESLSETPDQPPEPPPPESAPALAPAAAEPEPRLRDSAPPLAGGPRQARANDPLEPMNLRLYEVDRKLDRAISRHVHPPRHAPPHARVALRAARNVLDNLDEPGFAANDLLQLKFARALKAAARFLVNSTIGIVGISDVASRLGITRRPTDLDRTLASYGAPAGPYLYVPLAGPTTLRAVLGAAAEGYLYPPHWLHLAVRIADAVRGAGYAKMAQSALDRPPGAPAAGAGRAGYLKTRGAFYQARTTQKTLYPGAPRSEPTALALKASPQG